MKNHPHHSPAHDLVRGAARVSAIVSALLALACAAATQELGGTAHVMDGDTLEVGGRIVSLHGIDALEADQVCTRHGIPWACGEAARRFLERTLYGRTVSCRVVLRSPAGRLYARCALGDFDVGAELVSAGFAVPCRGYRKNYRHAQHEARQREAGMWGAIYERPEEWRRRHGGEPAQDDMAPALGAC